MYINANTNLELFLQKGEQRSSPFFGGTSNQDCKYKCIERLCVFCCCCFLTASSGLFYFQRLLETVRIRSM